MKKLLATLVALGSKGLFVAAVLDGAGLPIPGGVDVLVMYLGSQGAAHPVALASIAVLGSTIGNFVLFLLARKGGEVYLEKRSKTKASMRFREWFNKYGLLTVFISALVPLPVMPMKIFVLSAGALGSTPLSFLLTFVSARIPRYLGLAFLGRNMGGGAIPYLKENVWMLCGFAVGLFLFLYLIVRLADNRRKLKV